MLRFYREWGRLLLVGDTWAGRIFRWLIWAVTLGAFTWLQQPLELYLKLPGLLTWHSTTVTLGQAVAVLVAGGFLLLTAGTAWTASRGPVLWVGSELAEDPSYRMFRLRVENRGKGLLVPEALITKLVAEDGATLIADALLPFELHWSHEPDNQRPQLSAGTSRTIGVLQSDTHEISFTGMRYLPRMITRFRRDDEPVLRKVYCVIRVSAPGVRRPIERAFVFEPTEVGPLYHRASAVDAGAEPFAERQ